MLHICTKRSVICFW